MSIASFCSFGASPQWPPIDAADEALVGEMVEALVLAVALPGGVDERQVRAGAPLGEEALLERDRDLLGEADADEAAGRHRVAVADQAHRLRGGDDLALLRRARRYGQRRMLLAVRSGTAALASVEAGERGRRR